MSRVPGRRRVVRDRLIPALGLLAALTASGWWAWHEWIRPEPTYGLGITGGRAPGPRQRVAEVLRREGAGFGIRLTVKDVPGSVEALDAVNDGRIDVALVQGGLDSKRWTNIRQVAALYVEPLQLVVRGELALEVEANLRALGGRTVNLGEPGSGSHALAREVLGFVGLRSGEGPAGDYLARTWSHAELQAIEVREQLPDAVMTVSALPTPVVRHLISKWGYRLVPLPFGEAFALEDLNREEEAARIDPVNLGAVVDKVHLHETSIPAYTYGVEPAVPPEPLATFGARDLVVAHRGVAPGAVKRLLEAIFFGRFAQVARPPLDPSLLELSAEFPLHPGTVEFQQRNKPLILGDAVEFLGNSMSVTGPLAAGLFFVWQGLKRRYRRRRELGFESYLRKVTEVERLALQHELAARLDLPALLALQSDLGRIKAEAIRRFTLGELEGEGLMSGFLAHANDARDYLARLILHARSSIEKQARRQGLTPEAAWDLALGASGPPGAGDGDGRPLPTEGRVL